MASHIHTYIDTNWRVVKVVRVNVYNVVSGQDGAYFPRVNLCLMKSHNRSSPSSFLRLACGRLPFPQFRLVATNIQSVSTHDTIRPRRVTFEHKQAEKSKDYKTIPIVPHCLSFPTRDS